MNTPEAKRIAPPFGAFERNVAFRYLGATRRGAGVSFISIIAFLGIALSVATLIVVMSVMQGFRLTILDQLLSVSGHVFVTAPAGDLPDFEDEADRLRTVSGVTRVAPVLRVEGYAIGPAGDKALIINGMQREDLLAIEDVTGPEHIWDGNFESFGEGPRGGNEIALGSRLARTLGVRAGEAVTIVVAGGAETPFGSSPLTQKEYRVGAIFHIGNSTYDQYYAYMPLEQAQILTRSKGEVTEIEVRVEEPLSLAQYLPGLAEAAGQQTLLFDWTQRNADIFGALELERGLIRIILLMIVAVATLNIISGLVMLVKDKRSDIAILRTLGATKGSILRIFVLVGELIAVSGTVLGVVLGALIALNLGAVEQVLALIDVTWNPNVYYLDEVPSAFEWQEVGWVVGFVLVASFLCSVYPAWQASRTDPVEALRYE